MEPSGIGSITAPLNIEREGTHVFHRTRRGKDRPPALALGLIAAAPFVVIMDTRSSALPSRCSQAPRRIQPCPTDRIPAGPSLHPNIPTLWREEFHVASHS